MVSVDKAQAPPFISNYRQTLIAIAFLFIHARRSLFLHNTQ
jgi:hypothetical protein